MPVRTCAGCGQKRPKAEMLRIVRMPEGSIAVDPDQEADGRGVYLCRQSSCLKKAQKRRSLERGLKSPVPEAVRERLEKETENGAAG